jgi:tRNA(Ser,Leu) C12 N-acetylase TAN1
VAENGPEAAARILRVIAAEIEELAKEGESANQALAVESTKLRAPIRSREYSH